MLRRKLMVLLGWEVGLLVVVAVAAIWLLQGVLTGMDEQGAKDVEATQAASALVERLTKVEVAMENLGGDPDQAQAILNCAENLHWEAQAFATYVGSLDGGRDVQVRILGELARCQEQATLLAAAVANEDLSRWHHEKAVAAAVELRQEILEAGKMIRLKASGEQRALVARFRWVVGGLAVVFVGLINVSVMMLLKMGGMVLKPVEALVEGTRKVGAGEFEHRVKLAEKQGETEFAELALAFNRMAEGLQANERRKLETLAQAAVTLNHELNNASAIIKLQIRLLEKQSDGNPAFERALRQIGESVARMTATVEALKRVRRIVLTEYAGEMKMLDLERSVAEVG